MNRALIAVLLVLAACNRGSNKPEVTQDTSAAAAAVPDSMSATPVDTATPLGDKFDAGTVVAGRRVGTLQIADVKVQPAPASPVGSSGSIRFKGELQLTGQYRAHYEYPEKQEACFWPDVQEWRLLPRANGDSRAIWFCFSNKDKAIKLLGPLGTESQATIVVDNYTTNLATSDVWDTAKLVKVVSKTSK